MDSQHGRSTTGHGHRLTGPLVAAGLRPSANTALRAASPVAGTLSVIAATNRSLTNRKPAPTTLWGVLL